VVYPLHASPHEHLPMFENFQWPKPEEEADEKLIRNVRAHATF
jgi:hypothetical protein